MEGGGGVQTKRWGKEEDRLRDARNGASGCVWGGGCMANDDLGEGAATVGTDAWGRCKAVEEEGTWLERLVCRP
jgi:hypothetical protein